MSAKLPRLVGALALLVAAPARGQEARPAAPSLAQALAVLQAHPKVDLTHVFGPKSPVWSGFGQARFTPAVDPKTLEAYTIAHDGFRATYYAMVGQYGTHVDAPAHFAPDGRYLDEIPLDELILPLVVLDDTPYLATEPAHAFSPDDLAAWERQHGPVPKGAFVALRTDLSKDWDDPARFGRTPFPAWRADTLKILFEQRGIIAIGHEAMDTDATPEMTSERYVLGHQHWQIEVMTGLDKVPATGAVLVAAWPKPERGLGFPARVYAVLP